MSGTLIVTGGSRGIGAAACRLAARRGYAVCVNYAANRAAADEVVRAIEQAGGKAIAVAGDVGDEADVANLFATVDRELGPVTALLNNAGVLEHAMRLDEMDVRRWQRILQVNVIGTFLCAREAVRRMSTRHGGKGGAIVNMSSVAARLGSPNEFIDYAASKGAVDSLTIGLAKEVAEEGIRVNAVRPGLIDTEIHADAGVPDRVEKLKGFVPMKRGGTAQEVAQTALWLLSPDASYITGSLVDVAGGR